STKMVSGEPTISLTTPASESSADDVSGSNQVNLWDDHGKNSESESTASGVASEQQFPDNKESLSSQNLNNYANVGLVRDISLSYAPSQSQHQDSHHMLGFSAYDPPTSYDIPYFSPNMDGTVCSQVLSPYQEVLNSHTANNVPFQLTGATETESGESTIRLTTPVSESSDADVSGCNRVNLRDDHGKNSESKSTASGVAFEQHLPDNKESLSS
ncbi:hypothetical protein RYX36_034716, partial [Vicia faba]